MQKSYLVSVGIAFLLSSFAAVGQVASGNVAESAHPRADVVQAQNPRIHRTVEGCLEQQGSEYILSAARLGAVHLRAGSSELLSQQVGQRVKVRGNLMPMEQYMDDEAEVAPAGAAPPREMKVEKIEPVSGSCPVR